MNVSEQIIAVINDICDKIGMTIDWGAENVVPYVQDLIVRIAIMQRIEMSITIIVGIILGFCSVKWSKKLIRFYHEHRDDDVLDEEIELYITQWALAAILAFISIFMICANISDLITAFCLPEITAYQYITNLIH